jgi:exodeoxyribonuclease V gamma subunit
VRRPLDEYFRVRLAIGRGEEAEAIDDDEPFTLDGLASWALRDRLVARPDDAVRDGIPATIAARVERERAAGGLPLFAMGDRVAASAATTAALALARWRDAREHLPLALARVPVRFEGDPLVVDDWLDGLRGDGTIVARIALSASRVSMKKGELRRDRLIDPWIAMLVARANGIALRSVAVGCDAVVTLEPIAEDEARAALADLSSFWEAGLAAPLPIAAKTALAYGHEADEKRARTTYNGSFTGPPGERGEFASARLYADFDELTADARFFEWTERVYAPIARWAAGARIDRFDVEADEDEEADA